MLGLGKSYQMGFRCFVHIYSKGGERKAQDTAKIRIIARIALWRLEGVCPCEL